MWENIKELMLIIIPILTGIIGINLQKWWLGYKMKKFKLEDHPLFVDLALKINIINSWVFVSNRTALKDALIIKLKWWKNEGLVLAKELQSNSLSNLQLENKILMWASIVIDNYTKEWIQIGIPDKLIKRISVQHQIKVDKFIDEIKSICKNNDMYLFTTQKIIAMFDILRLLLAETIIDFNEFIYQAKYNGDFKGISYKNIPINDDEYETYTKTKNITSYE